MNLASTWVKHKKIMNWYQEKIRKIYYKAVYMHIYTVRNKKCHVTIGKQ